MRKILLVSGLVLVFACCGALRAEDAVQAQAEPAPKAAIVTDLVIEPLVFFNRVPQDPGEALVFYRKIAGQGNLHAQMNLGFLLAEGKAVPQDFAEAFSWFLRAADQGNATAQLNLALMYEEGLGTWRDPVRAARWYRKAAEKGNARAQYEIGRRYEKQVPTLADADEEAVEWYRKSADQGYARAQNALGVFYFTGRGRLRQDTRMAIEWCGMSADAGEPDAAYELGLIYKSLVDGNKAMSGRDLIDARRWLEIALILWLRENEGEGARKNEALLRIIETKTAMDALSKHMTQGEIDTAQEQAREWVDDHFPQRAE